MKIHLNPPQHVGIFNKTAGIYSAANGSIFLGTVLGLLTEYAILRHILSQHLTEFWQTIPPLIITSAAGLIVLLLAKERINYGKQAAKIVTDRESRQLGFAANSIVFIACFAVYGISLVLSYIGTIETVNNTLKPPALQTTAATDSSSSAKITTLNRQFTADSLTTKKAWQQRIEAERSRYNAKINGLQAQISAGKQWLKPSLKAAQNEKKQALTELQTGSAAAMLRLTESRQAQISIVTDATAAELQTIQATNAGAINRHTYLLNKASTILPAMVICALILVLLGCFIVEKFKLKAGITEVNLPNEYDLLPGILTEYKEAFKMLFNGILRTGAAAIRRRAIPATAVTDATAAELVRLNLNKYKEAVLNYGEPAEQQQTSTPTASRKNVVNPVITELFNTWRIERQRLQVYQMRAANGTGKDETIQAGIERHKTAMEAAERQINAGGFRIVTENGKFVLSELI